MENIKNLHEKIEELKKQRNELGKQIDDEYYKISKKFYDWYDEFTESLEERPDEAEKLEWLEDHSIYDSATIILAMLIERGIDIPDEWTFENYRDLYEREIDPIALFCGYYIGMEEIESCELTGDCSIEIEGEYDGSWTRKYLVLKNGEIVEE